MAVGSQPKAAPSSKWGPPQYESMWPRLAAVLAAVAVAAPVVVSAQVPAGGSEGALNAFGDNRKGQLGWVPEGGEFTNSATPVEVSGGLNPSRIAAGTDHSLAVDSDGQVWAWGSDRSCQLGDGEKTSNSTYENYPVGTSGVPEIDEALKVEEERRGRCSTKDANDKETVGQPTPGRVVNRVDPVEHFSLLVSTTSKNPPVVPSVAAGHAHSLALDSLGRVSAWGDDNCGQLGLGNEAPSPEKWAESQANWVAGAPLPEGPFYSMPQQVSFPPEFPADGWVTAIAAGGSHSLALDSTGKVWAWGDNRSGQLGEHPQGALPSADAPQETLPGDVPCGAQRPRAVPLPNTERNSDVTVKAIAAGMTHSLAIDDRGRVWTWGTDGRPGSSPLPSLVRGLPQKIVSLAAGASHSVAAAEEGTAWAWGSNVYGQLGDGHGPVSSTEPVRVRKKSILESTPGEDKDQDGVEDGLLRDVRAVAAGKNYSLALVDPDGDGRGEVWSWGGRGPYLNGRAHPFDDDNFYTGQTGHKEPQISANKVEGLADVTDIVASANGLHSLVVVGGRTRWACSPQPCAQPDDSGDNSIPNIPVDPSDFIDGFNKVTKDVADTLNEAAKEAEHELMRGVGPPLSDGQEQFEETYGEAQRDAWETERDTWASTFGQLPMRPLKPGAAARGGIFLSQRDPLHDDPQGPAFFGGNPQIGQPNASSGWRPNPAGPRYLIRQSVSYVTGGKERPRVLLVETQGTLAPRFTDAGTFRNSAEMGMHEAGFTPCGSGGPESTTAGCYEAANADAESRPQSSDPNCCEPSPGFKNLGQVSFADYDAVVVGYLDLDEFRALFDRRDELMTYVNRGGGLVGWLTWSSSSPPFPCQTGTIYPDHCRYLAKRDRVPNNDHDLQLWRTYLPFFLDEPSNDRWLYDGFQLTEAGRTMGLRDEDVNPGLAGLHFGEDCGFGVVEYDKNGKITSMAARTPIPTSCWGVRAEDLSVQEGHSGVETHAVTVTRPNRVGQTIKVHYRTADGTAKKGDDYVATSGTVTFAANEAQKTISLGVVGDLLKEPHEQFSLELNFDDAGQGRIIPAVVTIIDDDRPSDTTPPKNEGQPDHTGSVAPGDQLAPQPVQPAAAPVAPVSAPPALAPAPAPAPAPASAPASAPGTASASAPGSASASSSMSQLQAQLGPQLGAMLERDRQAEIEAAQAEADGRWLASSLSRPNALTAVCVAWGAVLIAIVGSSRMTRRLGRSWTPARQREPAEQHADFQATPSKRARMVRHHRAAETSRRLTGPPDA